MNDIDFTQYDRVQDTLLFLNSNYTLSFVVSLSKKNSLGQRSFYHYETQYNSDNYGIPLRSVKRNMSYYFLISDKEVFGSGIVLRPQDVEILLMYIQKKVLPWFFGTQQQHAFHMVDNKLVVKEFSPVIYTQSESKYIGFEPYVCQYENTNQFAEGVNIIFSHGESCPITIDKFMGMYNILKSDMYNIACQLCTYAKIQPYGINTFRQAGLGSNPQGSRDDSGWEQDGANSQRYNIKGSSTGFAPNSFLNNSNKK